MSERRFKPGDLILVSDKRRLKNENAKLILEWKGSFIITKLMGPTTAMIKKTPHSKQFHFHLNCLKTYLKLNYENEFLNDRNKSKDEEEKEVDFEELEEDPMEEVGNKGGIEIKMEEESEDEEDVFVSTNSSLGKS